MRSRPNQSLTQPPQHQQPGITILRAVGIRLLRMLLRVVWAVALLMLLRWIVLRVRRIRIRPTPYTTPPIGPEAIDTRRRRIVVSDLHLGVVTGAMIFAMTKP